ATAVPGPAECRACSDGEPRDSSVPTPAKASSTTIAAASQPARPGRCGRRGATFPAAHAGSGNASSGAAPPIGVDVGTGSLGGRAFSASATPAGEPLVTRVGGSAEGLFTRADLVTGLRPGTGLGVDWPARSGIGACRCGRAAAARA